VFAINSPLRAAVAALTPATAPTPCDEGLDHREVERMERIGVVAVSFAGIRKA